MSNDLKVINLRVKVHIHMHMHIYLYTDACKSENFDGLCYISLDLFCIALVVNLDLAN